MSSERKKAERRPNFSILALVSFIASFAVARTFATLSPRTNVFLGGQHIHHFWYGIILLAIGGWLGISYNDDRIDRIAAVVYGLGGGLVMDEVALLISLNPDDYWLGVTYTITVIFIAFVCCLILLARYSAIIHREFVARRVSLYFGVILAAVSVAIVTETNNVAIIAVSTVLAVVGCIIALAYFVHRIKPA